MRQLFQHLRSGQTQLLTVPQPALRPGHILIRAHCSLVSLGTEKMLVQFSKSNWIQRAQQQPERVKQVLQKVKTDGIVPTWNAVQQKLDQQMPLGYCHVGEVIEVGAGVVEFKVGDRVASNGPHADVVCVSKNLAAKIPDGVSDEAAAFTVPAAIALQGIRLMAPSFGESIVVVGVGLMGSLAVNLLLANGCHVLAIDTDEKKLEKWQAKGVKTLVANSNTVEWVLQHTHGVGADAVLITASTQSDSIISEAAQMSRKRGRIVLVGVAGLQLNRADFYEKELSFQVSCSYGPGRYDVEYEAHAQDYPIGFVRWTAKRNFESVLQAMASGKLNVADLTFHTHAIDAFDQVYNHLNNQQALTYLFQYPNNETASKHIAIAKNNAAKNQSREGNIALIGSGNYVQQIVLPSLQKYKAPLSVLISGDGPAAGVLAQKYQIPLCTSEIPVQWDVATKLVWISNRHSAHATLATQALQQNKNVFVEKPLAINYNELKNLQESYANSSAQLMVGYNRRYAPLAILAQAHIDAQLPAVIIMNINAGKLPEKHWLHDVREGGRVTGEVCHFIDLAAYLTQSLVQEVFAQGWADGGTIDNALVQMKMKNGSLVQINYYSNGSKSYPKERIEINQMGSTIVIDNWKKLTAFGLPTLKSKSQVQDKGHDAMYKNFAHLPWDQKKIISAESLFNTAFATLAIGQSIVENRSIVIGNE